MAVVAGVLLDEVHVNPPQRERLTFGVAAGGEAVESSIVERSVERGL